MSEHPTAAGVTDALARFPRERTWLLPALQAVQEVVGYLPAWALADAGRHLRVPDSEVYGVASHYPEFRMAPRGNHHVRVCTGVSCALSGGRALLDAIAFRYDVKAGESGADRELTLEEADCFFECSVAPLVEVDGAYRGRVTPEDIERLDRWFGAASALHEPATPAATRGEAPADAPSAEAFLEALRAAAAGSSGPPRRGGGSCRPPSTRSGGARSACSWRAAGRWTRRTWTMPSPAARTGPSRARSIGRPPS